MSVPMTSINAYYELKKEGKISERQELAFMTVRKFYEEKGYWPTPKEVHAYLAVEQGNEMAQFEGPNMVKPRITELLEDPGDDYPDLLEKKDESRSQEYIEELLDDYDSKKATPVKIAEDVIKRHDVEEADQTQGNADTTEAEKETEDGSEKTVIVPSDDFSEEDTEDKSADQESTEEDEEKPDAGDVIFGSEGSGDTEDSAEEEETAETSEEGDHAVNSMKDSDGTRYERVEDGVGNWKDQEGNRYILHPQEGFEEVSGDDENGSSENVEDQGKEGRDKEEKEASLNQYRG